MEDNEISYKGCIIKATPQKLLPSGKWSLRVSITYHDSQGHLNIEGFTGKDEFEDQETAVLHSLALGRQIIDGQVPREAKDH